MQVQISGKHVDVGEALRTRVTDEITTTIGKYFDRGGHADAVLSRDGHDFRMDLSVALASGQKLLSHGSGSDAHVAFDAALGKIETRIRRYKQRLKSHSIAAMTEQDEADWEGDDAHPAGAPSAMVVAEIQSSLKTMTVSGAVMELDLTESQTIVFRNAAHGGLSVVYRRTDGNIGWIDPERTVSSQVSAKAAQG
jgi:ribosomal subunit interface protein